MKRATVYFEEDLHTALKIRAAEVSTSVSDLVNEAIKEVFAEDLDDLEAFEERKNEEAIDFESFLKQMRKNGNI